jgi:hypothetical protein
MTKKVTDLTEDTTPVATDLVYVTTDPAGSPKDAKVELANLVAGGAIAGAISVVGNSTGQTGISATTWTTITQFDTDVFSGGVTADQANNKLVLVEAGFYLVVFTMSFSGTGNDTYNVRAVWNGVSDTGAQVTRKLGTGGDVGSATLVAVIDATSGGNDLQVEFQIDTSGDFTLEDGFLFATRLNHT